MISVSSDFKTAVRTPGVQRRAFITDGTNEVADSDGLQSLKITSNASLCRAVMRQAEAKFTGTNPYTINSYIHLNIGVEIDALASNGTCTISIADPTVVHKTAHGYSTGDIVQFTTTGSLPTGLLLGVNYYVIVVDSANFNLALSYDGAIANETIATSGSQSGTHTLYTVTETPEYIDYGSFKIIEINQDIAAGTTTLKLYDKMYEALQAYSLSPTYPINVEPLLAAICTNFSWTLATTSFSNGTFPIASNVFENVDVSFRDVIDQIAETSGSIIYFNTDDELVVRQISASVLETLTTSDEITLALQATYGPINSIVLSRQPENDDIAQQDSSSVVANGLTEFKIVNNEIVDPDRVTAISAIYTALDGVTFDPFTCRTVGLSYFETGDRIRVTDLESTTHEVVVLGISISLDAGMTETLSATVPDKTSTNYDFAGVIGREIKDTEITVNKQDGEIDALVSDTTDLQTQLTLLQETVDGLTITVENIGGTNLLKNSVGLKGTLDNWQVVDSSGNPTDARNTATITQTSDVINNTESHSSFYIANKYIVQTITTIVGETYTFYCRFKKSGTLSLTITGQAVQSIGSSDGVWDVFSFEFIATQTSTTIQLETTGSDTAYVSDIVTKLGSVVGWVQAPNEVYGSNFRFDKDGFTVISLTDTFKAVLNSTSLTIYDTSGGGSRIVMQVSKDSGKVSKFIAQDDFVVRRYEQASFGWHLIPTSTGGVLTIDD